MNYFKYVEYRFIWFIYSLFIGTNGIVFLFFTIIYVFCAPKNEFFNNSYAFMVIVQLLNRLLFNYSLVSSIEELEDGLEIIYLKYGMIEFKERLSFDQIKVINNDFVTNEGGYWSKPICIEFLKNKRKKEIYLPKKFGLGLSYYTKYENEQFVNFINEKGIQFEDRG